jgi:hypothetical protein
MGFPVNDFTGFWIGAKLLGTKYLYDIPANLAMQSAITGRTFDVLIFVRPPFFAAAMRLFTLMPYLTALRVWQLTLAAALVLFVAVYPLAPRRYTMLALAWSILIPIDVIALPNDAPLILLFVALSMFFWSQGRPALSGAMLGLCLAKFHFFVFVPLLLLKRENRKVLAGFAAVASILMIINFWAQPDWIRLYWQALNMPQRSMNSRPRLMPNFYASFFWTGHPGIWVVIGALLIGGILWQVTRHFPFDTALAFCVLGGLLAAPHANNVDGLLAIPALLAVAQRSQAFALAAALLLSPAGAMLYCSGPLTIGPAIFVGACLILMSCALLNRAPGSVLARPIGFPYAIPCAQADIRNPGD